MGSTRSHKDQDRQNMMRRVLVLCLACAAMVGAFLPMSTPRVLSCRTRLSMVAAGEVLPEKTAGFTVTKVDDVGDGVTKYTVKGFVTPGDYKRMYQETQAEHKKQANFRGFRAGKIPPALMASVREFAVVAAVESACMAGLEPYELEPVVPATGIPEIKINVPGDVAAFSRGYDGKSQIDFDAEVDVKGEPQGIAVEEEQAAAADVIDVTPKADEPEPVSG